MDTTNQWAQIGQIGVILALLERMLQIDLNPTAFLILMLIKKVKFGRNLMKNFDRSWPMCHAST